MPAAATSPTATRPRAGRPAAASTPPRVPPEPVEDQLVDHDLERQVIGACLQRPDLLPQALEHVTADDFYETRAKDAWRTIRAHHTVHGDALDQVLVADQLGRKAGWTPTDAHVYLAESVQRCVLSLNAVKYAVDLHTLAVQRRVRNLSRNLQTDLGNPQVALQLYTALAEYTGQQNGNGTHRNHTDPRPELEVLTAAEVCALPTPDRGLDLLGPLLRRGQRIVLGAHTGEGKTTLVTQILAGVAHGRDVLGWQGAGHGRALVIDAEQGIETIKKRLREAGLEHDTNIDYVIEHDGLELDDQVDADRVEHVLADADPPYDVVVADPLYKLHRGESNDERAATDLMRRFDAWRQAHGFALIVPVHARKPPPGQPATMSIHDLFGSSAYSRGAEVVIGLRRLSEGYARLYWLKDRDGDLPSIGGHWNLLYNREEGFRRDPADGQRKQTAADLVRYALDAAQPHGLEIDRLVEQTGKSDRSVRKALKEIGAKVVVGVSNRQTYHLPAEEYTQDAFAEDSE